MEPVLDNKDEEVQREQRAEKRALMRLEKQLQEQKREQIKKYFPLAAGVLGAILVLSVTVALIKKPEEKGTQQEQVNISAEEPQTSDKITGAAVCGTAQAKTLPELVLYTEEMFELPTPKYTFVSTDDTVTISSEKFRSGNAILINESTNTIVASKADKERINPASMTKVLTILVAAENITEENLDDTFTMTTEITDYAYVNDCSSIGFLGNENVTVRDLFYGTILPSGGDAAVGLATYIAGSHEKFVEMMNAKLDELGLADTAHFTNCVGLYDENHYCTVYDMAVIMKAAIQNEFCKEVLSTKKYTTAPTTEHPEGIAISNWFLRRIEDKDTGGEVLCAKTGYVDESRYCAVSFGAFKGGTPYICVTVGAGSNWKCINDHVDLYSQHAGTR